MLWINKSPRSSVFEQLQNAKCKVVGGQNRWQLLHLAAGRPFCTWDMWRYSSYLVPFPVDEWNKRKLMIPVRNNTFELTVMNETTLNIRIPSSSGYKMCVNREAKEVCAGLCWMHQNRRSTLSSLCSLNQQPFYSYCYSPFPIFKRLKDICEPLNIFLAKTEVTEEKQIKTRLLASFCCISDFDQ